jgi:hypothetical protein
MAGALREVFARFGVEVDDKKLDGLNKKVEAGASSLMKFGSVLVGALGARAIFSFAEGLAETGSQILDNSRKIGLTTDAYQSLGFAAKLSGVDIGALTLGIQSLQDQMVSAATKGGEAGKAFAALGVSIKDAHGEIRPAQDVLLDAADAIVKMDSPAKQTAVAMDLFGRAGKQLLPFLKEGRAGIQKLTAEFGELGGGFDAAAVAASDEFGDALDRTNAAIASVRGRIAVALLPVLQRFVDGFTKAVAWLNKFVKSSKIVETSLVVLGAALAAFAIKAAIAMAPILAPFLLWGAVIGGIILVLEDLYVWFKGGKSVIGEWLSALLGVEKAHEVLLKVRGVVQDISLFTHQIVEDMKAIGDAFSNRAESKEFQAYKRAMVAQGAHFVGGDEPTDKPKIIARRGGNAQVGDFGKLTPDVITGKREIAASGAPVGGVANNSVNVVVNAGNADARETARLVRQEVDRAIKAGNQVAGVTITREAPAR